MNAAPNLPECAKPARAPVFFWITVALLGSLFLSGAVGALLLVFEAKSINRSGGWGWLLVAAIYVAVSVVICFACALSSAMSLFRREAHRRLSTAILIASSLIVSVFGPTLIRAVHSLRHQRDGARTSAHSSAPPSETSPGSSIAPVTDNSWNDTLTPESERQQISELKSKLWEAIRARDSNAFVDCFFIEERFDTPATREENRNQVELLLRGETTNVEVRDIPTRELVEIMRIQNAKPASPVRYSLLPRLMLRIQQKTSNGQVGRSFLIGEKNGRWYLITLAGHTT